MSSFRPEYGDAERRFERLPVLPGGGRRGNFSLSLTKAPYDNGSTTADGDSAFRQAFSDREGQLKHGISLWKHGLLAIAASLVAGCAGYSGSNLKPGVSTLPEIVASMGDPAMVWKNPDGSEQLAYPRGPAGTQTFMAYVGPDGKLQRIDGVLDMAHFAKIQQGMSKDEVLRIIGPSGPLWTQTYSRSNTLAWSWLFCDSASFQAFFDVMFDASTGIVKSTGQRPNDQGRLGIPPTCGH